MSALATPCLARRVRLRWDAARGGYVLLVPEGVVTLTPEAAEILALCDGVRAMEAIVAELATQHPEAPVETLQHDAHELLSRLANRGYVTEAP